MARRGRGHPRRIKQASGWCTAWVSGVTAAALTGTAAGSEPFDFDQGRLFVIGDNTSETGNVPQASGGAEGGLPNYVEGRFTNGPVWHESLKGDLALAPALTPPGEVAGLANGVNLAHAGALTGPAPLAAPSTLRPDGRAQASALATFAENGFVAPFTASDIAAVWIGQANFRDALFTNAQPAVATWLGDVEATLTTLAEAGIEQVVLLNQPLSGDVFLGSTSDSPVRATFNDATRGFNEGLRSIDVALTETLGIEVLQVDVESLASDIFANPQVYGFDDAERACLTDALINDACPDTRFDYDGENPTQAGHAVIGEYVAATALTTNQAAATVGYGLDLLAEMSLQIEDMAFNQATRPGQTQGIYVTSQFFDTDLSSDGSRPRAELDGYLAAGGGEVSVFSNTLKLGGQAGYMDVDTSVGGPLGTDGDAEGWFASAYAGLFTDHHYFVAGGGFVDYDIAFARGTGFSPRPRVVAETEAQSYYASAEAGMTLPLQGGLALQPFARGTYAHFSVDGFEENGPLLGAAFEDIEFDSVLARAGVRVTWANAQGTVRTYTSGAVAYETDREVEIGGLVNQVDPTTANLDAPYTVLGVVSTGIAVDIGDSVTFGLSYDGRYAEDVQTHGLNMRLAYRF